MIWYLIFLLHKLAEHGNQFHREYQDLIYHVCFPHLFSNINDQLLNLQLKKALGKHFFIFIHSLFFCFWLCVLGMKPPAFNSD